MGTRFAPHCSTTDLVIGTEKCHGKSARHWQSIFAAEKRTKNQTKEKNLSFSLSRWSFRSTYLPSAILFRIWAYRTLDISGCCSERWNENIHLYNQRTHGNGDTGMSCIKFLRRMEKCGRLISAETRWRWKYTGYRYVRYIWINQVAGWAGCRFKPMFGSEVLQTIIGNLIWIIIRGSDLMNFWLFGFLLFIFFFCWDNYKSIYVNARDWVLDLIKGSVIFYF